MGVLVGQLRFLRTINSQSQSLKTHLWWGFFGKCPRCGKGGIFFNGLSIRTKCPACELNLNAHDVGDGPAVAATFFVGILALATALWLEFTYQPHMWVHFAVALPVVGIGSFLFLRPLKGILVSMQYRFRDVEQDDENLGQM